MSQEQPFISADKKLPEITFKVVILSIILCVILTVSNTYLALKIGLLTSASIPAAVISMGILRFFKKSNILENNLIQTAASAGGSIAGGIVYTIPALIIIQYWTQFGFWQNFLIALIGGVLGVMFSIPLRRLLMKDKKLPFPEGRAIAEVLKVSNYQTLGVKDIFLGGLAGAVLEFCQSGIKLLAVNAQYWFKIKNTLLGFGIGFSPAMIGAGYLIGSELATSIFIGAILSWLFSIAILSHLFPEFIQASGSATEMAVNLWGSKIRYIGIGAMLVAGLMTLTSLFKPLMLSLLSSRKAFRLYGQDTVRLRTDADIPLHYTLIISLFFIGALYVLYRELLPVAQLGANEAWSFAMIYAALFYTVIAGFIFCAITAYFSGMVGLSASPGSSVVIAALLCAALLIYFLMRQQGFFTLTPDQIRACEAIAIICTAMITGMASISDNNMQDLKVGHLLGATPWKQQVMLLLGVLCASLIITPTMQLLYNVYGIAGVMPHPGMDPSLSLPAPPAAVMATLSGAVFQQQIPWSMLLTGGAIILAVKLLNSYLARIGYPLSILGVAIGIYLPLASSMPLFIGGLIAWIVKRNHKSYRDTMLACGLIAGAALLDVILAIPFSIMHNPDALNLAPAFWSPIGVILSVLALLGLYRWFRQVGTN